MVRSGALFEGRFKSKLVPDDDYLLHLTRYIHLNPVRANLVSKPEEWKFSSYQDYLKPNKITFVNKNIILKQVEDYQQFVKNYRKFDKEKLADLLFEYESQEGFGKSPGFVDLILFCNK